MPLGYPVNFEVFFVNNQAPPLVHLQGKLSIFAAMQIRIVVAASEDNIIGRDNALPWHLPDDLRFFKRMTMGMPVVMGRNTWVSLGKALPGRLNVVISGSLREVPEGVLLFAELDAALEYLRREAYEHIAIIGGGQLYHSALPFTQVVYLTRVHTLLEEGTAFFPELPPEEWQKTWEEAHEADEKHRYSFTFQQWERK